MNIAFDATAILGPMSKNRGIGNYAFSQFTGMVNRDQQNQYFFLNLLEADYRLGDFITNKAHFTEDAIDTGKNQMLLRNPAYAEVIGSLIRRWLRENEIDVFYITSPFEATFIPYQKEWFEGVRVVVTVYDIIPYVMKNRYLKDENTYRWYMSCVDNLRWADALYVISESVKTDLIEYLHFPAEQIKVIWGAVDDRYCIQEIPEDTRAALLRKFGVTKPFIMCTGGEDGRKNLDGLIRAYSLMDAGLRAAYQLVVVCKLSPGALDRLQGVAREHHVADDVIFTNFVSDEELLQFYNLAALMAFPSKYEGFGLPIVEAWACGTPVLTADNSSLAQIGGDAALLVNADSDKSIAQGMEKMLSDPALLEEYTRRGAERLELYRWDKVNDDIIAMLSEITPCPRAAAEEKRIRLAFFTPLPPKESGISDYSEDVIRAMSGLCDIDVYIDEGYTPTSRFAENVRILPYTEYAAHRTEYADTVYQMGNSDFHFYMYDLLRQYHGTMVLHDYNLHGAFYCYAVTQRQDAKLYQTIAAEDCPDIPVNAAAPDLYGMELNGYLVNAADRIIVHSQEARRKLLERNVARQVSVIPSYAEILPLADAAAVKEKNGYPADAVVLAAFGGIHATKRAMPILRAFARLHKEFPQTRLLYAGKLSKELEEELPAFVKSEGLGDAVRVTGYISIEQFKEFIDMTDICLNLRYPSNGETSGSLMRILAKGRCVVINDIGSFSEFPDEICCKLPSVADMGEEQEPEVLYRALRELTADPERRGQIGQAARAFAEEHLDLRIVAGNYLDVLSAKKHPAVVTEDVLQTIRQDKELIPSDISGIAETLAYAAGA